MLSFSKSVFINTSKFANASQFFGSLKNEKKHDSNSLLNNLHINKIHERSLIVSCPVNAKRILWKT